MYLNVEKDIPESVEPVRSKYAPKRNRCHPNDPAYQRIVTQIQITKVIKRLTAFAFGENDERGPPIEPGARGDGFSRQASPHPKAGEYRGLIKSLNF